MGTENLIALISAIFAIIISVVNIFIKRKRISSDTVTKNRVDWISDVRELLKQFIKVYITDDKNIELQIIRNQICLYLRSDVSSYSDLISQMDRCIEKEYSQNNCEELIKKAQIVLSEVWIRVKREGGITKKDDDRFTKLFEKRNN